MSKKKRGGKKEISYSDIRKISCDRSATVHFIGIGGVSMYSLAMLTRNCGANVSGSDREEGKRTRSLLQSGVEVTIGQDIERVGASDLVVYSHAISDSDPELVAAGEQGIPIVSRAEYLGAMMLGYKRRIGVSGSHGKSTVTAMLALVFDRAGIDPTVMSGADLTTGAPFKLGGGHTMIYEACEYKDSFLHFLPSISVGLNLELDHTDYFKSIDSLADSFTKALGRADSFSLVNGDDYYLQAVAPRLGCPVITFGAKESNDYSYSILSFRQIGYDFEVRHKGALLGRCELNIPGAFNLYNATAAIAVANECDIDTDIITAAIKDYRGISGRLEYIGERYGRPVYYDYAHHPTEVMASISAIKQICKEPVTVVFKPHTFSRTASLWSEFCSALSLADYVVITDIYPAREEPIDGINSSRLAGDIGKTAVYSPDSNAVETVDRYTRGAILLMGAGDFEKIKNSILKI